jgi:hypothetical protein
MLAEYRSKTNLFIGVGIALKIVGNLIARSSPLIGWLIAATGGVLFIVGCCFYAKAKGYHGAVGLLGLLSCIGLIVLILLPDKFK